MKKKTPKEHKEIVKLLEALDWMFTLNNHERSIEYVEKQPADQPSLTAEITIDHEYQELHIKIYPQFFKISKDQQRSALLHELIHTTLADSKEAAHDLLNGRLRTVDEIKVINEKATSRITTYLDQLMRGNLKYARRAYLKYGKGK